MASGSVNKALKINHMTYTATTNASGRISVPVSSLDPSTKIVLRAYVLGSSYWILPYNYTTSDGVTFTYNFIVMNSENGSRISNTSVTLQIDYIEL